ncbi:MAG: GTPase ObgE [Campylobacteraceae bacterium]|jgi:GTP-binding protein|nr:GTPase ObgE [Campylobacteraceae bacterium]
MFIDSVELTLSSGKGGAGAATFRREKYVTNGGPDGGDGGKGGDIFFKVDRNSHTLSSFRGLKQLKAKNGENGLSNKKHGKKGEDLEIGVPPGTQVIDAKSEEVLLDLIDENQKTLFLEGGLGGLGNWHFRSSTNQQPRYAQKGLEGKSAFVRLELKLIADIGLVGFPNVGKSTLISAVSNARPQIANYEFTTLTPKLGVVHVDDFNSFVMADIPGIIDGASGGKGLGLEFLKHIERTKFLLFMLDITNQRSLEEQFKTLKFELNKFSKNMTNKKFAVAITKTDVIEQKEASDNIISFLNSLHMNKTCDLKYALSDNLPYYLQSETKKGDARFVLPISSATNFNVKALIFALNDILKETKDEKTNSN